MLGVSKSDIAKQIGWCSASMVDHYNDLEQIVKPGYTAKVLSSTASSQASSSATQDAISFYWDVNELKNFSPVFPQFVLVLPFTVLWLHILKVVKFAIKLFELWGELWSSVYFDWDPTGLPSFQE